MRTFKHPETGKAFVTGRNRPNPTAVERSLRMNMFTVPAPPPPPIKTNYVRAAMGSLTNIFGNDVEGNCTIAAVAHTEGVMTGNSGGSIFIPTLAQVNAMYSRCEGPPGFPAVDNGCDEITVLNDYRKNGLAGHTSTNWMRVDATNTRECQTALWLFENLYLTVELPDAWVNPFPSASGFTWNVEGDPDPSNGHAIVAVDYDFSQLDHHRFEIATWGMLGKLTPAALAKYFTPAAGGGCYTVLSQESINKAKAKAPNGLDWSALQSAFTSLNG